MPLVYKASFKNSQIFPRKATLVNTPGPDVLVKKEGTGVSPNGNTLIKAANPNRTYLTIVNQSAFDMRFRRASDQAITAASRLGFPIPAGSSYDLEGPEAVYASMDNGDGYISVDEGEG